MANEQSTVQLNVDEADEETLRRWITEMLKTIYGARLRKVYHCTYRQFTK
jgi:hypothetical protein